MSPLGGSVTYGRKDPPLQWDHAMSIRFIHQNSLTVSGKK